MAFIDSLTPKSTPADGDKLILSDSQDTGREKHTSIEDLSKHIVDKARKFGSNVPDHKVIIADEKYRAFGNSLVLPSGRIVLVYRSATSHTQAGDAVCQYSDDNGNTWTEPATLFDGVTSGNDVQDMQISSLTIGGVDKLAVVFSVETPDGSGTYVSKVVYSVDGETWGAATDIPELDGLYTTTQIFDTGSEWLIGAYLVTGGSGAINMPRFARSTDEGATWTVSEVTQNFLLDTQPTAGDRFILGENSYLWVASSAGVNEVLIGADLAESQANFITAINNPAAFNNFWYAPAFVGNTCTLQRAYVNEIGFTSDGTTVHAVTRHQTINRKWGLFSSTVGSATTWEVESVTLDDDCPMGWGCRPNILKVGPTYYMLRRTDNSPVPEGCYIVASNDLKHWYLDTNISKDFLVRYQYGSWIEIDGKTTLIGAFEPGIGASSCDIHLVTFDKLRSQQQISNEAVLAQAQPNPLAIIGREQLPTLSDRPLRYLVEDPCTSATSPGFEWGDYGDGAATFASDALGRVGRVLTTGAISGNTYRARGGNRTLTSGRYGTKVMWVIGNHGSFIQTRMNWHLGWSYQNAVETNVGGVGIYNDTDLEPTEFSWISYDGSGVLTVEPTGIPYSALTGREAYAIVMEHSSVITPWTPNSEDKIHVFIYKISSGGIPTLLGKAVRSNFLVTNDRLRMTVQTLEASEKSLKLLYVGMEASIV